jgi:hypothetical protein
MALRGGRALEGCGGAHSFPASTVLLATAVTKRVEIWIYRGSGGGESEAYSFPERGESFAIVQAFNKEDNDPSLVLISLGFIHLNKKIRFRIRGRRIKASHNLTGSARGLLHVHEKRLRPRLHEPGGIRGLEGGTAGGGAVETNGDAGDGDIYKELVQVLKVLKTVIIITTERVEERQLT